MVVESENFDQMRFFQCSPVFLWFILPLSHCPQCTLFISLFTFLYFFVSSSRSSAYCYRRPS